MKNTVGVSVICMDHVNFERDVKFCETIGLDYLHMDIMDGHFVPRYGLYPEILMRIADITDMPMDVHLMVDNAEFTIDQYIDIPNIRYINFHLEGHEANAFRIIDKIKAKGKKAGVAVNLGTSLGSAIRIANHGGLDSIVFMGIHPGVLKQTSRPEHLYTDVPYFLNHIDDPTNEPEFIQCDGGVRFDTIVGLGQAGINNFVCGSSTLFKGIDGVATLDSKRELTIANWERIKAEVANV